VTWRVRLIGDPFDLDMVLRLFPTGPVRISRDVEGATYLSADALEGLRNASAVHDAAEGPAVMINGAAWSVDPSFRFVQRDSGVDNDEYPDRKYAIVNETITVRDQATVILTNSDGVVVEQVGGVTGGEGTALLGRANSDKALAEALRILGSGPADWVRLYKVFEVLREDAGDETQLCKRTGVTRAEMKAFTASANRPDVSGDDARHGHLPGGPPRRTMTLAEGRALVQRLVQHW